jgi:hypothetical protein
MEMNPYDGSAPRRQPAEWRAVKRRFHMFTPFAANVGDEGER